MTNTLNKVLRTAKAWVAAAAVVVTALKDVLADDAVTLAELGTLAAVGAAAWGLVYKVGNKKTNDDE